MKKREYSINRIIKEELNILQEKLPFNTSIQTFRKGSVIHQQGEEFDSNYFVVSGILQLNMLRNDDSELFFIFVYPHEFVGDFSFYFKRETLFNIVCLTDCTLELMPVKEYKDRLDNSLLLTKLWSYILNKWNSKLIEKDTKREIAIS